VTGIVDIQGLWKVYRRWRRPDVVAVEGLDLKVGETGTVHGFLGPNGSGKTTTIRCALGLVRPTAGSAQLFGVPSAGQFHEVAHRVGAIVENPKLFPPFTGRKNLSLLATLGRIDRGRVDEVLETVGLSDRGDDSFASYSLGMRQRLAIAAALLKDPDLLILDEPANGLDPAGIAEMRVLIRTIADSGKAVLVSSHQLAEMQQVCDSVTIISNGRLVESGDLARIRQLAGPDQMVVTIDDRDGAITTLARAGIAAHPRPGPGELAAEVPPERASDLTRILAEDGRYLSGLRIEQASLEQAFLNLTGTAPTTPPPFAPPQGQQYPPGAPPPGDALPPGAPFPGQVPPPGAPPPTGPPVVPATGPAAGGPDDTASEGRS
jgi:ABC-2 type transport system ATP-binding protein